MDEMKDNFRHRQLPARSPTCGAYLELCFYRGQGLLAAAELRLITVARQAQKNGNTDDKQRKT